MPLILGTNSIKDTGSIVSNSLRFNKGSNDYLNRTFSTPTSTRKCTYSGWIKRSKIDDNGGQYLLTYFGDFGNSMFFNGAGTGLGSNDQFGLYCDPNIRLYTNSLFSDTSAWYHVVVAIDTTQGTASNRVKIYINGVQETSFATETYPSQNGDLTGLFGATGSTHNIGRGKATGVTEYFGGYMSEIVFIDGQQLDPTSFGEFDSDSGIWKPIDVSGLTFGNNGFYLDFEDSSALGNDVSGNGNNFTVNNLTSIDQSIDTCENNFATGNNLANFYPNSTFSEGNLKIVTDNSPYTYNIATIGVSSGKWFWEVKYVSATGDPHNLGIFGISGKGDPDASDHILGYYSTDYGITNNELYNNNSATSSSVYAISIGDKLSFALDLDSGTNTLKFYRNGTLKATTNISSSPESGFYFPAVGFSYSAGQGTFEFNFGSPPYSESGGNSDGNGYGNFSMAVPSGYYSLNTKNLAEYG